METNIFVVFTSFIWFNFFMVITILLRKNRAFYKYFSIHTILILIILCILKVFVVCEFPFTLSVDSTHIMTSIQSILKCHISHKNTTFSLCIGHILIIFSLLGSIMFAYKRLYSSYKTYKFFNSLPQTINSDINKILFDVQKFINFNRKIKIIVHKKIKSPAVLGYFKPIIILPQIDFAYEEMRGIFIHEITHCKCRHIILKSIIEFIKILFWWNPLVYLFSNEVDNILEFHADKKLSALLNEQEIICYLEGIVKVVKNNSVKQNELPSTALGLAMNKSESIIEQRFLMLGEKRYKEKQTLKNKIIIIISLLIFLISYMFVIQPYSEPTEEAYNDGAPVITDDYYIIKDKDNYTIYDKNGNPVYAVSKDEAEKDYNYLKIVEENQ